MQTMKEIVPAPPSVVRNDVATIQNLFQQHVVPSYGRFEIVLSHGAGCYLYDITGKRYLDLGGGIAVSSLGTDIQRLRKRWLSNRANSSTPRTFIITNRRDAWRNRSRDILGKEKFFLRKQRRGGERRMFKLARKFGHDEGRFEIITTLNSFHGRTLAGIAATARKR